MTIQYAGILGESASHLYGNKLKPAYKARTMFVKCDGCGFWFQERNLFSLHRAEEIKGKEKEKLKGRHKGFFVEEMIEYYCHTCAAERGLINPLRRQRPRQIRKHEHKPFSNLKLKAKNAIELIRIMKNGKSQGRTLHGLIDIMIINYFIIRFPAGLGFVPWNYEEIEYAVTPQAEFDAYVLLSDQLGSQHASHVMWEGGFFKTARRRASGRYSKIQRCHEKRRKVLDSMIDRLNTLREKAMKKGILSEKIEISSHSTERILEIFSAVHWELSTIKIRSIFAYYLYKTGMNQLQVAEDPCSLFPHMNRKTFMNWGKICERFEREERNLRRQHLV